MANGSKLGSEKVTLGFFADILHVQGVIPYEMYQDILDAVDANDLEDIIEKLLRSGYNVFKRGENRILTGE